MAHDHTPESDVRLTDLLAGELSPEDAAALAEAMAAEPELHAEQAELEAVYAELQAAARTTRAAAPTSLGPEGLAAILAAGSAAAEPEHGSAGSAVEAAHADAADDAASAGGTASAGAGPVATEGAAGPAGVSGGGPSGSPFLMWARRQRNVLQSIAAMFVVCGAVSLLYMGAQSLQKQQEGPQTMAMESGATAPSADQADGEMDDHLAGRSFAKADTPAMNKEMPMELADGLIGDVEAEADLAEEASAAPSPTKVSPMMARESRGPAAPAAPVAPATAPSAERRSRPMADAGARGDAGFSAPAAKKVDGAKDTVALSKLKANSEAMAEIADADMDAPTPPREARDAAVAKADAKPGAPAAGIPPPAAGRPMADPPVAQAKPQTGRLMDVPSLPTTEPAPAPAPGVKSPYVLAEPSQPGELQALDDRVPTPSDAGKERPAEGHATLPPGYPQRVKEVVFMDRSGREVVAAKAPKVAPRVTRSPVPVTTLTLPSDIHLEKAEIALSERAQRAEPDTRTARTTGTTSASAAPADAAADAKPGPEIDTVTPPPAVALSQVLASLQARGLAFRIESGGVVIGDPHNAFMTMPYDGDASHAQRLVQKMKLQLDRPASELSNEALISAILAAVPAQSRDLISGLQPHQATLMAIYLPEPPAATVSLSRGGVSLVSIHDTLRLLLAQAGLRHRVEGRMVVLHPLNRPLPPAIAPPDPEVADLAADLWMSTLRIDKQPLSEALVTLQEQLRLKYSALDFPDTRTAMEPELDLRYRLYLKAADGTPMVVLAPAVQVPAAVAMAPDRWTAAIADERLILRPREDRAAADAAANAGAAASQEAIVAPADAAPADAAPAAER